MANEKLIEYIKKTKQAGYNNEQIKRALKNKGWNDSDITEAMFEVSKDFLNAPPAEEEPPSLYPSSSDNSSSDLSHQDSSYSEGDSSSSDRKFNVMAIIAFALSFFVPIVGLILAIIGLKQIKNTGEKGKGFAIAAIVLNVLQLVFVIITLVSMFAYFGVMDPSNLLPERCQSSAGMDCIDKAGVSSTGVTFALRNNIGFPAMITNVQGETCQGPSGGVAGTSGDIVTNSNFVPFQTNNNEILRLKIDCELRSGDEYEDTFLLTYENMESGIEQVVPVDIRSTVS